MTKRLQKRAGPGGETNFPGFLQIFINYLYFLVPVIVKFTLKR